MRVLFAGTPAVALPSLEALLASRHEVVAVLTRPDAPAGRGRSLRPSPVKQRALAAGLEVLTPDSPRDPDFQSRLAELAVACAPVVAYGALLPAAVLDLPQYGWLNLHFSLLPGWRGAAPVQHAVLAGDEVTGASTFRIETGLDTGPVYGTTTETIHPRDTSGALLDRLSHSGAALLLATLDAIDSGVASPIVQSTAGVSFAPRLTVEDALLRWEHPALAVDRRIRACTPAPGAWTTAPDGSHFKLGPVTLATDAPRLGPGEILAGKHAVLVGTGTDPVELGEVAPAGKRPMAAADWARGAHLDPGARLGAA